MQNGEGHKKIVLLAEDRVARANKILHLNIVKSHVYFCYMKTIDSIIKDVENGPEILKPKDLVGILGVSPAWIYQGFNTPLEHNYTAKTGHASKNYYVIRRHNLVKWLKRKETKETLVRVWERSAKNSRGNKDPKNPFN